MAAAAAAAAAAAGLIFQNQGFDRLSEFPKIRGSNHCFCRWMWWPCGFKTILMAVEKGLRGLDCGFLKLKVNVQIYSVHMLLSHL